MTVISGAGELVAMVPTLLGFTPDESVLAVMIRESGEIGVVMRADREGLLSDSAAAMATEIAREAARDGARVALVLAYTRADVRDGCPALATLRRALEETVAVVETWAVAGGAYFSPGCDDPDCCPRAGRPIPEVAPMRGVARLGCPDLLTPLPDLSARRRATRAGSRWLRDAPRDPLERRRAGVALWREAVRRDTWDAAELGRLARALEDLRVRDAALLWVLPDSEAAMRDAAEGLDSRAVAAALGDGLIPRHEPAPAALARAEELLLEVLRHANGRRGRAPAAMLGVLGWWSGSVATAVAWSEEALDRDPGYRLALLVLALVETRQAGAGRP